MRFRLPAACVATLIAMGPAATLASPVLKFKTFGTVGMFLSDSDTTQVAVDTRQGSGSTGEVRFDGDSQLSGQASLTSGAFSGVLQVLSKRDHESSYEPTVEWAYLGWQASPQLNVKLGRTVAPVFMLSDYRNLYYSQTMARPFETVYPSNPITHQDGLSLLWQQPVGEHQWEAEGFYGSTKEHAPAGTSDIDTTYGIAFKWITGAWTLRAGGQRYQDLVFRHDPVEANFQFPYENLASFSGNDYGVNTRCFNCADMVRHYVGYDIERERFLPMDAWLTTVGVQYDDGDWVALSEYQQGDATSALLPQGQSWYAMLGRRFDAFTPYLAVGQTNVTERAPTTDWPGKQAVIQTIIDNNIGGGQPFVDFINLMTDLADKDRMALGAGDRDQVSIGVRWDPVPHIAIKAQLTHAEIKYPELSGDSTYLRRGFDLLTGQAEPEPAINSFTLNLDFAY
jgi:hypothetical protein